MMDADFIACLPRVMVTDGDRGRKKHVITRCDTLKGVVWLFIHVKKSRLKSRQLQISGSPQDRARVSKRTRQMFRAEVRFRQSFGILIRALRKMEHCQFRPLFKERYDALYTI